MNTLTSQAVRPFSALPALIPGIALVGAITAAAYALRSLPIFAPLSPMILGILIGVLICNFAPLPRAVQAGIKFSGKNVLRFAVALLGFQITLGQLAGQGFMGLASAAVVLFATFFFTLALGKRLGVAPQLSLLIGAGTSVCGAAAIAGVNGTLRAKDEDVTYAVAAITFFGTLALFVYPLIASLLGLDGTDYGRFIGLSVHEVAQVVGAGFQGGTEAGQTAVIVKLTRVILLAPLILVITLFLTRKSEPVSHGMPALMPWFVTTFLIFTAINSLHIIPKAITDPIVTATPLLMTAALTALGLGTKLSNIAKLGLRPFALCAAASLFILVLSLIWVAA